MIINFRIISQIKKWTPNGHNKIKKGAKHKPLITFDKLVRTVH